MNMRQKLYKYLPSIQEIDKFLNNHGKRSGRRIRNQVQKTLDNLRISIVENNLEPVLASATSKQNILEWIADRLGDEQPVKKVINAIF